MLFARDLSSAFKLNINAEYGIYSHKFSDTFARAVVLIAALRAKKIKPKTVGCQYYLFPGG